MTSYSHYNMIQALIKGVFRKSLTYNMIQQECRLIPHALQITSDGAVCEDRVALHVWLARHPDLESVEKKRARYQIAPSNC